MPRYFFHVKDGQDLPDDLGSELPDTAAVRGHALKTAGEMLRDGGGEIWSGHPWTMTVLDDAGEQVLTLQFAADMTAP